MRRRRSWPRPRIKRKMELNKKAESWKMLNANARERERMGIRNFFPPWASMYQDIGGNPQALWRLLSSPRPIPVYFEKIKPSLEAVLSATEKLIEAAISGKASVPTDRPVRCSAVMLRAAVDYNFLRHLRRADARWSKVEGTNRTLWKSILEAAAAAEKPPAVPMPSKAVQTHPLKDEIAVLSVPTRLSIEKLEREPLEETGLRPHRRSDDMVNDELRRSFLAALLGQAARSPDAGSKRDADAGPPSVDLELLLRRFLLARQLQKDKDRAGQ